jgi:hypothetical protein
METGGQSICSSTVSTTFYRRVSSVSEMSAPSRDLPRIAANVGRILLAVVGLFLVWVVGGFIGAVIWPHSPLMASREPLAAKIACSIAILALTSILQRYLLRGIGAAMACLALTEVAVYVIIMGLSGLVAPTGANIAFNAWWLLALTWNVVIAFLLGTVLGALWMRRTSSVKRPAPRRGR